MDKVYQLRRACGRSELDEVKRLVNEGVDVDSADGNDGWTPLMFAAHLGYNGNVDIIQFLLDRGANVNSHNNYGWTPLMIAANNDHSHVDIVQFLLDSGANVDMKSNDGVMALHDAASY